MSCKVCDLGASEQTKGRGNYVCCLAIVTWRKKKVGGFRSSCRAKGKSHKKGEFYVKHDWTLTFCQYSNSKIFSASENFLYLHAVIFEIPKQCFIIKPPAAEAQMFQQRSVSCLSCLVLYLHDKTKNQNKLMPLDRI